MKCAPNQKINDQRRRTVTNYRWQRAGRAPSSSDDQTQGYENPQGEGSGLSR